MVAKATVTVAAPEPPCAPAAPSGGQYFAERPDRAVPPRRVELTLPDVHLRLDTDAGVFSPDGRSGDQAAAGRAPRRRREGDVADVGCGYGAIAVTLAGGSPTGAQAPPTAGTGRWGGRRQRTGGDLCRRNAAASGSVSSCGSSALRTFRRGCRWA